MSRHHSPSRLGKGLQARSLTGNALAGSAAGRALVNELRATYSNGSPTVGLSGGRVVVLVQNGGLTARPTAEQIAEARRIAMMTRAHLASGPWYARRLVDRAVTLVFEDRTLEEGCDVLRYVEYTVLAPTFT